jgi:hypothetical protein
MNSDLMPSSESSNASTEKRSLTPLEAATDSTPTELTSTDKRSSTQVEAATHSPLTEQTSQLEDSSVHPGETESNGNLANRQQPIPPPSEPMQYRAIGLVRGHYTASSEQFTQGRLVTTDHVELNAVLLGRIMSLVKNHLDLEQEHLWVVYPRTRQENDALHLQIVGVWEPENLAKHSKPEERQELAGNSEEVVETLTPSSELPDGDFSVRGEVVYQSFDAKSLVVKIKQAPRKPDEKPKYFKLKLRGVLTTKAVGKFWDFKVKREADALVVENAQAIADLPKKRRPPFKGGSHGGKRNTFPPRRNGETPLPIKKVSSQTSVVSRPIPKTPAPKPIKRTKPVQE